MWSYGYIGNSQCCVDGLREDLQQIDLWNHRKSRTYGPFTYIRKQKETRSLKQHRVDYDNTRSMKRPRIDRNDSM
jgi:hypothetical protein